MSGHKGHQGVIHSVDARDVPTSVLAVTDAVWWAVTQKINPVGEKWRRHLMTRKNHFLPDKGCSNANRVFLNARLEVPYPPAVNKSYSRSCTISYPISSGHVSRTFPMLATSDLRAVPSIRYASFWRCRPCFIDQDTLASERISHAPLPRAPQFELPRRPVYMMQEARRAFCIKILSRVVYSV